MIGLILILQIKPKRPSHVGLDLHNRFKCQSQTILCGTMWQNLLSVAGESFFVSPKPGFGGTAISGNHSALVMVSILHDPHAE
jgi:hypothetical protein